MKRVFMVVVLMTSVALAIVFLLPGWGKRQHEALNETTAEQLARTELARVAGKRQSQGLPTLQASSSACLVSRRIDPDFKQYIFSF